MQGLTIEAGLADLNGRYDLYGLVHKGLRLAQTQLLTALGTADFTAPETDMLLARVRRYLSLAASHLSHEDTHIHPVLERAGVLQTGLLERQHDAHRDTFIRLEALIRAVERAEPQRRPVHGRRLYLVFGVYVAHDLLHMFEEETVAMPELWAVHSDAEIGAIEGAIIGSLSPQTNMAFMEIMIPAGNREERAALMGGIKAGAPAAVFDAVMDAAARPKLSPADYADLCQRLGLTQTVS